MTPVNTQLSLTPLNHHSSQEVSAVKLECAEKRDRGELGAHAMSGRFPVSRPLPAQADRRRSDRKRVMREAVLLTEDAEIIAECMLEDLSASGARLRAPARVGLSPKFLLWDGIAKNLCACE